MDDVDKVWLTPKLQSTSPVQKILLWLDRITVEVCGQMFKLKSRSKTVIKSFVHININKIIKSSIHLKLITVALCVLQVWSEYKYWSRGTFSWFYEEFSSWPPFMEGFSSCPPFFRWTCLYSYICTLCPSLRFVVKDGEEWTLLKSWKIKDIL